MSASSSSIHQDPQITRRARVVNRVKKVRPALGKLKTKRKWKRRTAAIIIVFTIFIAIFAYFTNPFVRFSLIVDPFHSIDYQEGQFVLSEDSAIIVRNDPYLRVLGLLKAGWHIVDGRFVGGPKAKAGTVDEIIAEIHNLRFNPEQPFLISGDHFSVLYPRSLGIFYHSALDSRTALNEEDWKNRQLIYLKTTAYALQVFEEADRLSTTVVPIAPRSVVLINIYDPPSDTLYSLMYALRVLQDKNTIERLYPYSSTQSTVQFPLQTTREANKLLDDHKQMLERYFKKYQQDVYDQQTGLVRTDISLSGTKDIARRHGAFYDNVIFWRTTQLAQELGVTPKDEQFLFELKNRIIKTYWDEETGVFLEDLSERSKEVHAYSSDWLIVQMTGFLDPNDPTELIYLKRVIEYIQENEIDQPFGMRYETDTSRAQLAGLPRIFAPAYGTTAIWSNWGQEYIKLLVRVGEVTGDEAYFDQANKQLEAYTFNITRYRGYPEVYDTHGDFFRQMFYKSVRQTGWVVSYEQARGMYKAKRETEIKSLQF